jgi:hypothetical protein
VTKFIIDQTPLGIAILYGKRAAVKKLQCTVSTVPHVVHHKTGMCSLLFGTGIGFGRFETIPALSAKISALPTDNVGHHPTRGK